MTVAARLFPDGLEGRDGPGRASLEPAFGLGRTSLEPPSLPALIFRKGSFGWFLLISLTP